MTDYHLATFVTDKDKAEVTLTSKNSPDGIKVGTRISKRKMFEDGQAKGEESVYAAGQDHNGSRRVYFSAKAQKQANTESDHALQTEIFKGCRIFNNSGKSPHELKRLIESHGGRVIFTRETEPWTHFVTEELTDSAKRQEEAKKLKDKHAFLTVTEAWVHDSISEGRRLNEFKYSPYGKVASDIGQFLTSGHTNPMEKARLASSSSSSSSRALSSVAGPTTTTSSSSNGGGGGGSRRSTIQQDKDRDEPTIEADPVLFLQQYLRNSRLHFIGTWRDRAHAQYKAMSSYQEQGGGAGGHAPSWLPAPLPSLAGGGRAPAPRVVLHADMDCFFVTAALVSAGMESLLENVCPGAGEIKKVPVAVSHGHDEADEGAGAGAGGSPSKSRHVHAEVSSCNYSARERGVRAGMSLGRARQACPELRVVPYAFRAYDRLSALIYEVLLSFGGHREYRSPSAASSSSSSSSPPACQNPLSARCAVEIVSVDEAYLELPRGSDGLAAARELGARVLAVTGCRLSVGVGANKLLARLATRKAKPPNAAGVYAVDEAAAAAVLAAQAEARAQAQAQGRGDTGPFSHSPSPSQPSQPSQSSQPSHHGPGPGPGPGSEGHGQEPGLPPGLGPVQRAFLLGLRLAELPGVGYKTQRGLSAAGMRTCEDVLRAAHAGELEQRLRRAAAAGKINAKALLRLCRGEDDSAITPPQEGLRAKSIAVEVTWGVRFSRLERVVLFLRSVCQEVHRKLVLQRRLGNLSHYRKVTLKVLRRHPSVPQTNTPELLKTVLRGSKFLGHGKCDSYSRTVSLPHGVSVAGEEGGGGSGGGGGGADTLADEVLAAFSRLRSELGIDVMDLRGLGVQVSDFASSSSSSSSSSSFSSMTGAGRGATVLDYFQVHQGGQRPLPSRAAAVSAHDEDGGESDGEGEGGEGAGVDMDSDGLSRTQEEVLAALQDPADREAALQMLRQASSTSRRAQSSSSSRGSTRGVQPGIKAHFQAVPPAPAPAPVPARPPSRSSPTSGDRKVVDLTEESEEEEEEEEQVGRGHSDSSLGKRSRHEVEEEENDTKRVKAYYNIDTYSSEAEWDVDDDDD